MFERARGRAVDLGYAAGWGAVKALPEGMTARGFRAAADAASIRNGAGAKQLRRNLRRVVGPAVSELRMDRLVGEALRSYARYWRETFRLESMDHERVVASIAANFVGLDNYRAAVDSGKGAILALPHSGNWEASGIWLAHDSGVFTTVAERLKPDSLFERFVAYRESLGMEVLALTGGERPPMDVLGERLRAGRVVCLLADRDLSRHGIDVDFFGEPARMPAGPALLAVRTGASLHAVTSFFVGDDGWGHSVSAPIPVPAGRLRDQVTTMTQQLADGFAQRIALRPTDWHMLQRLWLADLSPERTRPAAGASARGDAAG